jgi:hypothetical protein
VVVLVHVGDVVGSGVGLDEVTSSQVDEDSNHEENGYDSTSNRTCCTAGGEGR